MKDKRVLNSALKAFIWGRSVIFISLISRQLLTLYSEDRPIFKFFEPDNLCRNV